MNDPRWTRMWTMFGAALDRPASDRAAALAGVCGFAANWNDAQRAAWIERRGAEDRLVRFVAELAGR